MQRGSLNQLISAVAFAALIISPASYATCQQADMAGIWHLFYGRGSIMMKISSTGEIIQGSYNSLLDILVDIGYPRGEFYGGSVDVLNNCRVVGEFPETKIPPNDSTLKVQLLNSRTRPDTQYWFGNLEITIDFGLGPYTEYGSFSAVRILRY